MTPGGIRPQGGTSPVPALIHGATANVALLAVLVAILSGATHATVVVLIGVLCVAGGLAYRATRRHLRRDSA